MTQQEYIDYINSAMPWNASFENQGITYDTQVPGQTLQQAVEAYNNLQPVDVYWAQKLARAQNYYQSEGQFAPGSQIASDWRNLSNAIKQWQKDDAPSLLDNIMGKVLPAAVIAGGAYAGLNGAGLLGDAAGAGTAAEDASFVGPANGSIVANNEIAQSFPVVDTFAGVPAASMIPGTGVLSAATTGLTAAKIAGLAPAIAKVLSAATADPVPTPVATTKQTPLSQSGGSSGSTGAGGSGSSYTQQLAQQLATPQISQVAAPVVQQKQYQYAANPLTTQINDAQTFAQSGMGPAYASVLRG